jgi:hypothetical protein
MIGAILNNYYVWKFLMKKKNYKKRKNLTWMRLKNLKLSYCQGYRKKRKRKRQKKKYQQMIL